MSAYSSDKKTLAYELGRKTVGMTDHYLLMTATHTRAIRRTFALFLQLLDRNVYGDVASIDEALRSTRLRLPAPRKRKPCISRPGYRARSGPLHKEEGGDIALPSRRRVGTHDALTRYVETNLKGAADNPHAAPPWIHNGMLQRGSLQYRRPASLERMHGQEAADIGNPAAYVSSRSTRAFPTNFDDLPEEEQQEIMAALERCGHLRRSNRAARRRSANWISFVAQALLLEKREVGIQLRKLREVLTQQGIFEDPKMKLLIFTEHRPLSITSSRKCGTKWQPVRNPDSWAA